MPRNVETERYFFLDGLRAIAMIFVMMDHSYDFYWRYVPNYIHTKISPIYAFFSGFGREGVYMFFMISGFLITGIMIKDFSKDIDVKKFYLRRFFKIVPLFSIVVLLVFLLAKLLGIYKEYNDSLYLIPLFYLQDFFHTHPIFQHAWSLTVEMEFYLVYPLMALAIFKCSKEPEHRRFLLLRVVLILAVLSIAFRHWHSSIGMGDINVFDFCDGLFFGCALRLLEPYFPKLNGRYRLAFVAVCLGSAFLVLRFFTTMVERKLYFNAWDNPLCMYIVFTALFFCGYYRFKPVNFVLENRFLRWFGTVSYAFYLWHYPMRYILVHLGPTPNYGFFSSLMCYWLATLAMAAISTYTIERYFLNLRISVAPAP